MIASGKLRAWGVANWAPEQVAAAARAAERQGVPPPCAAQLVYSLVNRTAVEDPEMLAALELAGASVVASASLQYGALSGKYAAGAAEGRIADEVHDPAYAAARGAAVELEALGARLGASPATLAYAFALSHEAVASVLFGATRPEQVVENVAAAALARAHGRLRSGRALGDRARRLTAARGPEALDAPGSRAAARRCGAGCTRRTPADGPFPVVVMAGGWCYVKELVQPHVARHFADTGLAAILFDYRNFGSSDGTRRQHIDPNAQIEDYRNAISFAETLGEVDADRIGVWGLSYSGGHALILGATDPRVQLRLRADPRRRRLSQHAPRARHDRLPPVRAAAAGRPASALPRRARTGSCPTPRPTRPPRSRPGRSPRPTRRSST